MPAEQVGDSGTRVLVVGDYPGDMDDHMQRPHSSIVGTMLRRAVEKYWSGSYVLDYAVRCAPRARDPEHAVDSCRPYLAGVLNDPAGFDRIIAVGGVAIQALTGRDLPQTWVRRGYHWLKLRGRDVPVFYTFSPFSAARNTHIKNEWLSDLRWALNVKLSTLFRPPTSEFNRVETLADALEAVRRLRGEGQFAYDCETWGRPWGRYGFEVQTLAACPRGSDEAYVWGEAALTKAETRGPLLELLEDPDVLKDGHNLKYDMLAPRARWGTHVRGVGVDTRLLRKLDDCTVTASLEMCSEHVAMGGYKQQFELSLAKAVGTIQAERRQAAKAAFLPGFSHPALEAAIADADESEETYAYALVKESERQRYCARDSVATARCADEYEGRTSRTPTSMHVWTNILRPAATSIEQVEAWGLAVDTQRVQRVHEYLDTQVTPLAKKLEPYGDINFNSPPQVAAFLYDKLRLPLPRSGKRSTSKDTLNALKDAHPAVADLMEYRRLNTLKSRYGLGMLRFVRADGRVHPEIKIDGAETGRLSVKNPHLHQIPRKKDVAGNTEGRLIKDCYVAEPGCVLLQLDYSQLELRVAAELSGDPVMLQMFRSGADFHMATARLISRFWGLTPDQVGDHHRTFCKTINFGLLYGMSDYMFAARLGCTKEQAAELRALILGNFKVLARWMQERLMEVRRTGFAWTEWAGERGRRRPLFGIAERGDSDEARKRRKNAQNSSVNTPVQGSASEYCLDAVSTIVDWVQSCDIPAKVVLTVHDSVILEAREDAAEDVALGARARMTARKTTCPLKVDTEWGTSWGSLEKLELKEVA